MQTRQEILRTNYDAVCERIQAAANAAHRSEDEITLVGVTKYVDIETTRDFVAAGCSDLGESRPQVLWPKAEALTDLPVRWHQIGHLQRNKLRKTQPLVSLIHSVDSIRLLQAIDNLQGELAPDSPQDILLEVNTSGDEAKHGFTPANVNLGVDAALECTNVRVRGLMCMAGLGTAPLEARRDFAKLRELRDRLQQTYAEVELTELSMGMSGDFEEAIAEGATLVRVGSVLFEGVL